jgi:hypothetical protein
MFCLNYIYKLVEYNAEIPQGILCTILLSTHLVVLLFLYVVAVQDLPIIYNLFRSLELLKTTSVLFIC